MTGPALMIEAEPVSQEPAGGSGGRRVLKRLVADTGWMGLVVVVPMVVRLAVTPVRVRMLDPAAFGEVSLWVAVVAVVGGFALWPATGLMRYLPAGTTCDRAQVTRAWLVATGATAVVASAGCLAWSVRGGSAWGWVAGVAALEVFVAAAMGYARAVDRFKVVTAVSITGNVGGLVLGTLLIPSMGPVGVLAGWLVADMVAVAIAAALLLRSIASSLRAGPGSQLGRLVRFSAPLAVSNGTWMLVTWLDRPLLVGLVSTAEIGVYSLAYSLVAAPLAGLFTILSSVTWNHAVRAFETEGYGAAAELLRRSARVYSAIAVPIAVWLAVFGADILAVLAPSSYAGGARHMVWLAVGLWCFGLLPYRNQHLMLWDRSRAAAASPIVALALNVLVLLLTAPYIGAVGAAVATAAAYGGALAVASWFTGRDARIDARLPVRLNLACLALSGGAAAALSPLVDAAPGRVAQTAALAVVGVALVGACLLVEGSAPRALSRRLPIQGSPRCAT